jgi:hypothetical protein
MAMNRRLFIAALGALGVVKYGVKSESPAHVPAEQARKHFEAAHRWGMGNALDPRNPEHQRMIAQGINAALRAFSD